MPVLHLKFQSRHAFAFTQLFFYQLGMFVYLPSGVKLHGCFKNILNVQHSTFNLTKKRPTSLGSFLLRQGYGGQAEGQDGGQVELIHSKLEVSAAAD